MHFGVPDDGALGDEAAGDETRFASVADEGLGAGGVPEVDAGVGVLGGTGGFHRILLTWLGFCFTRS